MTIDHSPGDVAVLHVTGALRAPTSGELKNEVEALLRRGERRILLNLAAVSDVDAAGLGELIGAHNMAAAANGVLRMVEAAGRIRTVLDRAGLLDLLGADLERVLGGGLAVLPERHESRDG